MLFDQNLLVSDRRKKDLLTDTMANEPPGPTIAGEVPAPPKKKRRPRKSEIETLRLRFWARVVMARAKGKNEYWLDLKLARPRETPPDKADKRKRLFGRIRQRGVANVTGWKGRGTARVGAFEDSLEALIQRVDDFDQEGVNLRGTAQYFRSPLWMVLDNRYLAAESVRQMVADCLQQLGLARPTSKMEQVFPDELKELYAVRGLDSAEDPYTESLAELTEAMPNPLDAAALVLALAREADVAGNWAQRDRLYEHVLDRQVERINTLEGSREVVEFHGMVNLQEIKPPRTSTPYPPKPDLADGLFGDTTSPRPSTPPMVRRFGTAPPPKSTWPTAGDIEEERQALWAKTPSLVKEIERYRMDFQAWAKKQAFTADAPVAIDAARVLLRQDERWSELTAKAARHRLPMREQLAAMSAKRRPRIEPDLSGFVVASKKFKQVHSGLPVLAPELEPRPSAKRRGRRSED